MSHTILNPLRFIVLALVLFLTALPAHSAVTPLSIGLVPPLQFPPDDFTITGLRVSAGWGHHRNMYGIDLGLLGNITDQDFTGIAISGVFNYTTGTTRAIGMQLAGLTNINTNKTSIYGVQLALGANYNAAQSSLVGLQLSLANLSAFTDIYGFQVGIYNRAKDVYGLQIGLINVADNLHGIQIGLLNFNRKGPFVVAPLLNVGF